MPRTPRVEVAGGVHHVTARAVSGRLLFSDEDDHRRYLRLLAREVAVRGWLVFSWCHMPNHVHLLLQTPEPDLGRGVKGVHERFATYLNERHGQHGHVFGDRFHNRLVVDDAHFVACLRYIARNPVAAGLCGWPSDWRWGAHRALVGLDPAPAFLRADAALSWLGHTTAEAARASYAELVLAGDRDLALRLCAGCPDDGWLVEALDVHRLPARLLGEVLGTETSRMYRRATAARKTLRANQGTVP